MRERENVNNRIATGGTERNAFYNGWEREDNRLERKKEKTPFPR